MNQVSPIYCIVTCCCHNPLKTSLFIIVVHFIKKSKCFIVCDRLWVPKLRINYTDSTLRWTIEDSCWRRHIMADASSELTTWAKVDLSLPTVGKFAGRLFFR